MNLCAVKMAAVFMVSTSTVEVRTGFTPHWIEFLGFGCALLLLLSGRYIRINVIQTTSLVKKAANKAGRTKAAKSKPASNARANDIEAS